VIRLSIEDQSVRKTLLEVFHLVRPPGALFRPRISGTVLWRLVRRRPARP
jgi:hypothetical protein